MRSIYTLVLLMLLVSCSRKTVINDTGVPPNDLRHLAKPYVVLISLDGYRYDYVDRFKPQHLLDRIDNGVRATSLLPCFPTKTFPNHYSIATGMYPEHHGLVGNTFYDPDLDGVYAIRDRAKVEDGQWYGGTPIWTLAEMQGMRTACYFFVGSEADVLGVRPTYYYKYDGSVPNTKRTQQAIDWLKLPEDQRPHLISMYFSDVDTKTHRVGPGADQAIEPVIRDLDTVLGDFFDELDSLNLPINVIIVSDHGMMEVPVDHFLPIERFESDDYRSINNGTYFHIYPKKALDLDSLKQELVSRSPHIRVEKVLGSPFYTSNQSNPRLGAMVVLAEDGYFFVNARKIAAAKMLGKNAITGQHGYPLRKEMEGIFYAFGSNIDAGVEISSFENIHIYPLICQLLGLDIPQDIDGEAGVLRKIITK